MIIAFVSIASTQSLPDKGKLNDWATELLQRNHKDSDGCLSSIRIAKNKGFDRMVFEFKGNLNSYTIYYLLTNKDHEGERIKIAGKIFMNIDLYGGLCENENYPKGKLNFPVIQQISGSVFEGIQNFVIGIKAEKPFRVSELNNPTRLVIDFKH